MNRADIGRSDEEKPVDSLPEPADLRFACYPLWSDEKALGHYGRSLGLPDPGQALTALALAVSNSLCTMTREAVLVTRLRPHPLLAVLGCLDEAQQEQLKVHALYLSSACASLRYVPYSRVEEDCERLASRLIDRFGRSELEAARFVAIPRGGWVVLGLLATVLGLKREQLISFPQTSDRLFLVVDDCALTGARFGEYLDGCESRRVVFAHLYSHPELRAAVERREDRVVACLSANDLAELAISPLSSAGRKRWFSRLDGKRYWVGCVETLCFPWNEPDGLIWNPVSEEPDKGWHVVPPELCLKNRPPSGIEPIPVQAQPEGRGPIKPSKRCLFGQLKSQTVLSDLESKRIFALDSVGGSIWRAIVRHGNIEQAMAALLTEYEVNETTLRRDVVAFIDDFLARDLLENTQ